ncbi:MAG TPA: hypothetical protein VFU16_02940 [Solirubrobacterales bacterium]|nr:hypothetical protein [Solirubrobacterales bacterium]
MRKLPLLLALLLLSLLGTAVAAQAALLPQPGQLTAPFAAEDEGEDEAEAEASDADEEELDAEEACDPEEEICEEEEQPKGRSKDDACLLKDATVAVSVNPGKRRLRLVVRYRTWKPAGVSVEAVLRGVKGAVYLGTSHVHFRRSGVYRDTYELAERETRKALAAREVSVDLRAINTPPSCRLHLTESLRRAKH